MDNLSLIKNNISSSIDLKAKLLADEELLFKVAQITALIVKGFRNDKKLLLCGNGGSAADAQHLAAEFSGKYYYDRPPLFAEALHVNTSYVTAVSNDYGFAHIYSRLLEAMGREGDILIGLSTSGNSENVINAFNKAKDLGITTVGFTGEGGGKLKEHCDVFIEIPSSDTPRIQECHMLIGHTICQLVEMEIFPQK